MPFKHGHSGIAPVITSDQDVRLLNGARLLPRSPGIIDHFTYGAGALNSHVPQNWVTTETGAATPYAPSTSVAGGALVGVTGATTNNAEEVAGKAIIWNPSTMGPLVLEARFKAVGATTPVDGDWYFGLADAVTYTNGLPFVVSAASALTTTAPTVWCGFGYSSIPTSGALFNSGANFTGLITVAAGVGTVQATTKTKDSSYHVYRVEVDVLGNAVFFIDDDSTPVGVKNLAFAANTALTPYLSGIAKNSHANTLTIDYIHVGGSFV